MAGDYAMRGKGTIEHVAERRWKTPRHSTDLPVGDLSPHRVTSFCTGTVEQKDVDGICEGPVQSGDQVYALDETPGVRAAFATVIFLNRELL